MTMKHGFEAGLIIGFLCWLFYTGIFTFNLAPLLIQWLATLLAVGMSVLSVTLGILQVVNCKATLRTTGDGLVYGFTTTFSILYIVISLINHSLPLPF
jgi:hypothetical protein